MLQVKQLVPQPIKVAIKARINEFCLKRIIRRIDPSRLPSEKLLAQISKAWGNESWSADTSYLAAVCFAAMQVDSPVLECGSGLTTLLLAIFAGSRGVPVVSLEHHSAWHLRVVSTLKRSHLQARVALCPIRSWGDFDWYTLPEHMPRGIGLVICDGPPASTRGGRVGMLPACREFLRPGCLILMDDAEREGELKALEQWRDMGSNYELIPSADGSYARASL